MAVHAEKLAWLQLCKSFGPEVTFAANSPRILAAASRNACGQSGSAGPAQSAAQITARRPPNVKRGNVPVADRILPQGVGRDPPNGEVDFDETRWILVQAMAFMGKQVLTLERSPALIYPGTLPQG